MAIKKGILVCLLVFLSGCSGSVYTPTLIPGNDQVNLGGDYTPESCLLIEEDGTEYEMDIVENTVDTSVLGTYEVRYEIRMDDENYTCTRKVFVLDLEGPSITLNPGIDTLFVNDLWQDAGIRVSDNVSVSEAIVINSSGTVLNEVGTYTIVYQAIDEAGNSSFITRIVTVHE